MDYSKNEVLQFVLENDVKFIKLSFCDIYGALKNISIMANELPDAFEYGVTFDTSSILGFANSPVPDLLLFPDPSTLCVLPWRPQQGRVVRLFCFIKHPDGTPYAGDGRYILEQSIKKAEGLGYTFKIGTECEFYLFEADEKGNPTQIPHDFAGYFDAAPLDKGENVRRDICLTLEEMGIQPENSHHEHGFGQNEIDFKYSDTLLAADNFITFKTVVKTIAARNGLFASFMPKPIPSESGNGLHVNLLLYKNGQNIITDHYNKLTNEAESFVAGILNRMNDITVFLNTTTNSYKRFGEFEAPKYLTWSQKNCSQLIRVAAIRNNETRIELRSPDPACNPYLAFALLLQAGLEGIAGNEMLCAPTDINLNNTAPEACASLQPLPDSLNAAIQLAKHSDFIKNALPDNTLDEYLGNKKAEYEAFETATDQDTFEQELYFRYL